MLLHAALASLSLSLSLSRAQLSVMNDPEYNKPVSATMLRPHAGKHRRSLVSFLLLSSLGVLEFAAGGWVHVYIHV